MLKRGRIERQQCPRREKESEQKCRKRNIKKEHIFYFDLVPNANGVYVVDLSDLMFRAFNTAIQNGCSFHKEIR